MSTELHPVLIFYRAGMSGKCSAALTRRAYDVYCHVVERPQANMLTGECGGFGIGELMAFLYARSFPKDEWKKRVEEAFDGMQLP